MSDDEISDFDPELDPEQLDILKKHLLEAEEISIESALESRTSFEQWIIDHRALRQMFSIEKLSDIIPTLFNFFRAMLGFPVNSADADAPEKSGSGTAGEISCDGANKPL